MYFCKRLRLLIFLEKKGFKYIHVIKDKKNPNYSIWLFEDSEELRKAVEEYYSTVPSNNSRS